MTSILDRIVARTRRTIAADQRAVPAAELTPRLKDLPPCRGFAAALAATDEVRLIAEIKRASPSAGLIREDFEPAEIARQYAAGGAACISVLTEQPHFGGSLDYLPIVRAAVEIPILRKDFIIDRYQIDQARVHGADCVLLIAECLSASELADLYNYATSIGLDSLIELYEPSNLENVLRTGCRLVGVNNRNLHTFETSLDHTIEIGRDVPANRLLIGESGIGTFADLRYLAAGGVKAVLVGESLMRQPDITAATRRLLGAER